MDEIKTIINDVRPIKQICSGDGNWAIAANENCTIHAYEENGQMAYVTWFAICNKQGEVTARINAAQVQEVIYR